MAAGGQLREDGVRSTAAPTNRSGRQSSPHTKRKREREDYSVVVKRPMEGKVEKKIDGKKKRLKQPIFSRVRWRHT